MSDLNNPLFESQKEFLERQKQEYKNALLSDVQDLKEQSQKVGKTLLIAGGALAGVWMVRVGQAVSARLGRARPAEDRIRVRRSRSVMAGGGGSGGAPTLVRRRLALHPA